jgi:hypothetical protein
MNVMEPNQALRRFRLLSSAIIEILGLVLVIIGVGVAGPA